MLLGQQDTMPEILGQVARLSMDLELYLSLTIRLAE